jgi:hypothetical protein
MENMGQKQPGRAAADDCYLGSRRPCHRRCAQGDTALKARLNRTNWQVDFVA